MFHDNVNGWNRSKTYLYVIVLVIIRTTMLQSESQILLRTLVNYLNLDVFEILKFNGHIITLEAEMLHVKYKFYLKY